MPWVFVLYTEIRQRDQTRSRACRLYSVILPPVAGSKNHDYFDRKKTYLKVFPNEWSICV